MNIPSVSTPKHSALPADIDPPRTKGEWLFPRDTFTSWAPKGGFEVGPDECPWIPNAPGIYAKFTLINRHHNSFVNLFKIDPDTKLPPHDHTQPVVGYVPEGEFKYEKHDWVGRPGSASMSRPARSILWLTSDESP